MGNGRAGKGPRDHLVKEEAEGPDEGVTCSTSWPEVTADEGQELCALSSCPQTVFHSAGTTSRGKTEKHHNEVASFGPTMIHAEKYISPAREHRHTRQEVESVPRKIVDFKPTGLAPTVKKTK